jgi:DNA (cytosine-5)-methyltransferase 1
MANTVAEKLRRLQDGHAPRVLDLFSGCGGLLLGFHRAGCASIGGVEHDADAAQSFAWNFHRHEPDWEQRHGVSRNIVGLRPHSYVQAMTGIADAVKAIDLIIGGPPCPAFTRIGRAKLRDIHGEEAHLRDRRAGLYRRFVHFVEALQPVAVVMENVPDILNFGGRNVGEKISLAFERLGYECRYTLLNAANYGVPQMRERFILVAIHHAGQAVPVFPAPTHRADLPPGYESSRRVALKHILAGQGAAQHYLPHPLPESAAAAPVTAEEAIGDLPVVLGAKFKRGAQRLDGQLEYPKPHSAYARQMRLWPGLEAEATLRDHVTRALTERDFRLFRRMKAGDDYPAAIRLAVRLFEQRVARMKAPPRRNSTAWQKLWSEYVPPYDVTTFPNRWRKMERVAPARTLMAHLGKDAYSHIHYDGEQARTITVREAARLQSFPDGFCFKGTMNPAFKQIGNAVPPLLAFNLAKALVCSIGATVTQRDFTAAAKVRAVGT